MSNDVNKFQFRLVLLGSNGTGFLFKKFETKYKPTVEDLFSQDFDLGAIELKVDFLDTSGSMQFPAMRRLSITTGNAFLIVYSVDDPNSFDVLKMCVAEIQEVRPDDYQEVPIVFVGNKVDIPKEERKVSKEQVSNYVFYELPRLRTKVIECSCKDNINIESIFKAYLSLAKVKLSTTGAPNCNTPLPPTANSTNFHYGSGGSGKKRSSVCSSSSSSTNQANNYDDSESRSNSRGSNSPVPSNNSSNHHHHHNNNNAGTQVTGRQRSSSIKLALGVRKSCDASIISSMRKVSLSGSCVKNSREQLGSMKEQQHQNYQESEQQQQQQQQTTTTEIILLRDAMSAAAGGGGSGSGHSNSGNKLSVNSGHAKPRSRSLIWRPSRKSSRTSPNDSSDCRVT